MRYLLRPILLLFFLVAGAWPLQAQQSENPYRVGDSVQVEYAREWFTAVVTEVRSGSIRAKFRDERQYPPEPNEWFQLGPMVRPVPGTTPSRPTSPASRTATPSTPATPPSRSAPAAAPAAPVPVSPVARPAAGPGATKFKVGDEVQAICMGSRQDAVIAAVEGGQYRMTWVGGSCGDYRDDSTVFPRPTAAPKAPTGPMPARLATGSYTCFANVPHYTGSTYMRGVGSVPQYRFTWERVGTLQLSQSTYRSGSGAAASYRYDSATGKVVWGGGMHAGIASNVAYSDDGRLEIQIHRKDGRRGTWHCRR